MLLVVLYDRYGSLNPTTNLIQYMHVMFASICLCMNTLRTVVYYTLAISIYVCIHVYACTFFPTYNSHCSCILTPLFFSCVHRGKFYDLQQRQGMRPPLSSYCQRNPILLSIGTRLSERWINAPCDRIPSPALVQSHASALSILGLATVKTLTYTLTSYTAAMFTVQ